MANAKISNATVFPPVDAPIAGTLVFAAAASAGDQAGPTMDAVSETVQLNLASGSTAGQVLTSTGDDSAPTMQTPALVLIATATPSGTGVVTFSSLGSFGSLKITGTAISSAAADIETIDVTFNGDTGSHYTGQNIQGSDTTVTANAVAASSSYATGLFAPGASFTSTIPASFTLDIFDYGGATFQKAIQSTCFLPQATTGSFIITSGGFWAPASPAAITSITLTLASGNFVAGSRISLYGVSQ
jgi:hypothetical protein